eukprot:8245613-Pyramimonas_sp.AAC.1
MLLLLLLSLFGGPVWQDPETPEREFRLRRKCSRRPGESPRAHSRGPTMIIVLYVSFHNDSVSPPEAIPTRGPQSRVKR